MNDIIQKEDKLPSYIKQSGESRGNENISAEDIQLPRINILQALSPQINEKKDDYIEGSKPGMIFNTLTGQLYSSAVAITPVYFTKKYLVWVDRKIDSKGGLKGIFDDLLEAEKFLYDQPDKEKLEIVPTAEHLAVLDDGTEVIVSMAKSKMKVSRKLNSLIRLNGGDRFSRRYILSTVDDESSKGEFKNFSVSPGGFPSEQVYLKAENLFNSVVSEKTVNIVADYPDSSAETEY